MAASSDQSGSGPAVPQVLLRREWFGGLCVDLPSGRREILDPVQYAQRFAHLSARQQHGEAVRMVDVTTLGYPLRRDGLSTPASAFIDLTDRCDGRCVHCFADTEQRGRGELSLGELDALFGQLATLGTHYVRLSGGEPTLRDDLGEILDCVRAHGMRPSINTHGQYGEERLRRLIGRVSDIRVSLDGPEDVNDRLRGPGSYRRVLATLSRLAEIRRQAPDDLDPTINVVLMKDNQDAIPALTELSVRLGLRLSFGLLRPVGRATQERMLSPHEVLAAVRTVQGLRRKFGLGAGQIRINFDLPRPAAEGPLAFCPFPFDGSRCPVGMGIGVTADGRLVPCNYLAGVAFGRWIGEDVRGKDLLALWNDSPVMNAARALRRPGCHGCSQYRHGCDGGCPATALVCGGDADGSDPYCVRDVLLSGGVPGGRPS